MTNCPSCGVALRENAKFCGKCGVAVKEAAAAGPRSVGSEEIKAMAEELRAACDKLLASYTAGKSAMETAINDARSEAESRVAELEERIRTAEAERDEARSALAARDEELKELRQEKERLSAETPEPAILPVEPPVEARPTVCPSCGAELEEGAMFCGNCGQRIS